MNQNQNEQKDPVSIQSIAFKNYKLTKEMMKVFEKDYDARKLLLKIQLDDLNIPTSMQLWAYPAKDHKHYAEQELGSEILPEGNEPFTDTKNIWLGNNELALKYFHFENKLSKPFRNFSYVILTPFRKAIGTKGNLAFKIDPYNDKGEKITILDYPVETNPSPPAKPEEI